MSLFGGQQKQTFLGVDLGAGGIKVVELANEKGRARLVTYGFTDRLPEEMGLSFLENPDQSAALLKQVTDKAKCTTKRAVAGIPVSQVFSSILSVNVPPGKKKELDEGVKVLARKIAPRPLEEMVVDYKVIEETPKATKVLLTAAESSLVRKYLDIFRRAGLELASLETEALALIRALIGRDKATVLIVDVGAIRTNISLIQQGVPFVSRSIDVGGISFTRAIAEQLKIPLAAAEQMKQDVSSLSSIMPEGTGVPRLMEPLVTTIQNEVKYVTNIYASQQTGAPAIEKVVLTGGGAMLPRLADILSNAISVKAYVGDPWARVVYPEDIRPILDQIGPRLAVSVGLAMRDIG